MSGILILFPYLVSFFGCVFFGNKFKDKGANLAILGASVSFLLLIASFFSFGFSESKLVWFEIDNFKFEVGFILDSLSILMAGLVALISWLIFIYSKSYMAEEKEGLPRFYAFMSLFAFSMTGIVISGGFFQMIFFWELVGLCSYMLIGFWYKKKEAMLAAKKAFLTVIFGDLAMIIGIILLFAQFGTMNFTQLNLQVSPSSPLFTLSMVLVLVGAFAKSAQFPLHIWLPDAMAGPAPVSALLHSAAMVKAGLFLIARTFPLFLASGLLPLIFILGFITFLIGALMAMAEVDIKRILAFSTISNLGLISLTFGMGDKVTGLLHLFNHAFFKALLFLVAGLVLHLAGTKDINRVSGTIFKGRPLFLAAIIIGSLGLAGIPPLNGFWSKEQIFSLILKQDNIWLTIFFSFGIFLSAFYIFRWLFLNISSSKEEAQPSQTKKDKISCLVKLPLIILGLGILVLGILGKYIGQFLDRDFVPEKFHFESFLISISLILISFGFTYLAYYKKYFSTAIFISYQPLKFFHSLVQNRFWIDYLYDVIIRKVVVFWAFLLDKLDRIVIDGFLNIIARFTIGLCQNLWRFDLEFIDKIVNGIGKGTVNLCRRLSKFDDLVIDGLAKFSSESIFFFLASQGRRLVSGFASTYMLAIILGVIFIWLISILIIR